MYLGQCTVPTCTLETVSISPRSQYNTHSLSYPVSDKTPKHQNTTTTPHRQIRENTSPPPNPWTNKTRHIRVHATAYLGDLYTLHPIGPNTYIQKQTRAIEAPPPYPMSPCPMFWTNKTPSPPFLALPDRRKRKQEMSEGDKKDRAR